MDDGEVVRRVRAGDRDAWADVYDRYADRLYDHCWSILRDRHEAEDALHDAFITAAERIDQLRDPDRLRPWLYAICRTSALARVRRRGRLVPTAEVDAVSERMAPTATDDGLAAAGARDDADLARVVWEAAAGLNERDRAVLDLHLRHGLTGDALGEALGVSGHHASVLVKRVRDLVDRSLGALLVGRAGRRDCAELDALLSGWDGTLSPLIRKRVARHIDRCATCGERRRALVSPAALLGAAPVLAAPLGLRIRILGDLGVGPAGAGGGGQGDGSARPNEPGSTPPGPPPSESQPPGWGASGGIGPPASGGRGQAEPVTAGAGGGRSRRRRRTEVLVALLALLVVAVLVVVAVADDGPTEVATAGPASPAGGGESASGSTVPPGGSLAGSTVSSPTAPMAPGSSEPGLVVEPADPGVPDAADPAGQLTVDPGPDGPAGPVTSPVVPTTAAPPPPPPTAPVTATTAAPPPPPPPDLAPVVDPVVVSRSSIAWPAAAACRTATVTATVTDEATPTVALTWRSAVGVVHQAPMTRGGDGRYRARVGPVSSPSDGPITWWVTASDPAGHVTETAPRSLPVGASC